MTAAVAGAGGRAAAAGGGRAAAGARRAYPSPEYFADARAETAARASKPAPAKKSPRREQQRAGKAPASSPATPAPPAPVVDQAAAEFRSGAKTRAHRRARAAGGHATDAALSAATAPVRWVLTPSQTTDAAAGFFLGVLAWGWVGLPLIRGGPAEVKRTLLAKFFNKAPDGSFLP